MIGLKIINYTCMYMMNVYQVIFYREYIYDCIWSMISLYGWPDLLQVCIVCNECHNLDWTINYLSRTNTLVVFSAALMSVRTCLKKI